MTTNQTVESELTRLRADLLEFVMSELTAKLAEDGTQPASTALVEQVAMTVEACSATTACVPTTVTAIR